MTTSPTCPNCGAALPADAPEQLCPACLFSAAEPTQAPTVASGERMPPAPTPEELAPDFPGLEILELIGRGGMGAVYKARQKNLDRLVALKILPGSAGDDPHFAERFQREAQALARLNHPNIVSVFDFGRAGSVFYFLMEYVDGTNLRQMIRTGKMMPEEALAVVPKICDALQFAHEEGVVHRDVKPENILIDKRGRVKIADFGLAKLLRREQADPALTMTGMTLGTPRYMAPEQLDKPETVDHRADIYSLGVVIYEMLTGEVPMGRFAPPSEKVQVDVRLDEIVLHALERDADRRYQHVSQVREDVEMVTSKPAVAPEAQSEKPDASPRGRVVLLDEVDRVARRRQQQALFAGTLFLLVGAWAMVSLRIPPAAIASWIGSVILFIVAFRTKQQCVVEYLGHSIEVETGLTSGRLVIDGRTVAAGAVGPGTEFSGRVPSGAGSGDRIIARNCKGFISYPCRLFVEARSPVIVSEAKTDVENVTQPAPAVPAREAQSSGPRAERAVSPSSKRPLLQSVLTLFFFATLIFAINFRASSQTTTAGRVSTVTVGTVDPLFVYDGGPGGFHQSIQFFSWSFLALIVAGVTFGALWRIGREDQGKVVRDPAWWRGWWKQVGFWCGLLLIGCIVRTVRHPEVVLKYVPWVSDSVHISEDPSRIPATRTAGRTDYAYKFSAPANHRLYVWIEWWKGGKRTIDQDCNTAYVAKRGDRLERSLQVVVNDGKVAGPATAGKVRIDWLFDDGKGNSTSGRWRPDFFEGLATSVDLNRVKSWKPKVGETVNLLEIRGGKESIDGNPVTEERLRAGRWEAVMILRARVEAVSESRVWEGTATKFNAWNDNEEPSPALLRLGGQFGAKLDPFTDARNLREQIAYRIKTDAAERTKAEKMLKDAGIAFAADEKAEEVVKKLETAAVNDPPKQAFMIGTEGPELTTEAITKLKLSKLQIAEINRALQSYHREYLALHRRHSKVGTDDKGRIAVTVEPFYDECLALATRLQNELGGIVDAALLPVVKDGAMPFQVFHWGGAFNQTVTMWKADGKYNVEEKLTGTERHPRDPYTFNMSGPNIETFPEQFRIYWREDSAKPAPPAKPAGAHIENPMDTRFAIQQDRSQLPATAAPGRQDYAFKFSGPADHTLNVWMEVWQEGRMEWVSNFDFEAKPKAGQPLAASLTLTAMAGDAANKGSKGKTRLDWTMNCGGSEGKSHTANTLIADLSASMGATYSTWERQTKPLNPRPGETVTVLGITGYKLSNFRSVAPVFTETDLLKRWPNAAVLVRARFSPATSGELGNEVGLGTKVSDQTFERRTFAQFEISKQLGVDLSDCRTPAEAHAALVAAASTPDGRARAAQMVDELGSDNIAYVDQFRFAAEPMLAMWWKLRKKEPATAEEVISLLENFITAVNGPGSHGVQWNHGEPITKWAEGPSLNDSFAKKLKLTKLQIDEVNKLLKKYADEANALRRRHTKVTRNNEGHVLINIEPYSEECLELARKMVAELGGIVTQDIVPAVKVGALPMAIFGNAGECRETVVLKKDSDGVYVIRIITSDWVPAGEWRGDNTTGWGSKDIDLAFGSYKMYWTEE